MAAFWAALAATFSAIASLMIMLIQRRNLIESVRPELILTEWKLDSGNEKQAVLYFGTVKNVGKGIAFNIVINLHEHWPKRPPPFMGFINVEILAVNEERAIDGKIYIFKEGTRPNDQHLMAVTLKYTDTRNYLHETEYSIYVMPNHSPGYGNLAPGIFLSRRSTTSGSAFGLFLERTFLKFLDRIGEAVTDVLDRRERRTKRDEQKRDPQ